MSGHHWRWTKIRRSKQMNECVIPNTRTKLTHLKSRGPEAKVKHDTQSHMEPRKNHRQITHDHRRREEMKRKKPHVNRMTSNQQKGKEESASELEAQQQEGSKARQPKKQNKNHKTKES